MTTSLKMKNGSLLVKNGHLCDTCCCPEYPIKVYLSGGQYGGSYSSIEVVAFDAAGVLVFSSHSEINGTPAAQNMHAGCPLQLQGTFENPSDPTIEVTFGPLTINVSVADLNCDTTCQGGNGWCNCDGTPDWPPGYY